MLMRSEVKWIGKNYIFIYNYIHILHICIEHIYIYI